MSTVPSGQPGANKPTGSTKKQRRKAAQRRQLLTFGAIVVLVLVVAAAVWGCSGGWTAVPVLRRRICG